MLKTPDFDTYPTERTIADARPIDRGVEVHWDDGLVTCFHVLWLRENAPDPKTTHPESREQSLQLLDIDDDLKAIKAGTDGTGRLSVNWSSGDASLFDPGWLRAFAWETDEALFALPERRLWDSASMVEIQRFDADAVSTDETAFGDWCRALHVEGCAILEGVPTREKEVERIARLIGPVRDSNFGHIFDVRTSTEQTSLAYTAMELPLHADLCTREHMPGLQFLHCIENSTTGGASMLADGFKLADQLASTAPEDFEALSTIPLTFYNKAEDTDYRWDSPFIGLDAAGSVNEIRFSPWLRAPVSASFDDVDRVYRALRHIFTLAQDPANQVETTLRPGQLLAFDNSRVLHGRRGFDATSGSRWLQGCYGEREELHSQIRIHGRRQRKGAGA